MKNLILKKSVFFIFLPFFLVVSVSTGFAQEVMLDKMEKCGDLICYPEMKDVNRFYYLPDQPRIAYKNPNLVLRLALIGSPSSSTIVT